MHGFSEIVFLLPLWWAAWEFMRRYTGDRPRAYATGLVCLPVISPLLIRALSRWETISSIAGICTLACCIILFYRLFTSYPAGISKLKRKSNQFALIFSLSVAGIPMVGISGFVVACFAHAAAEQPDKSWWALVTGFSAVMILVALIYTCLWSHKRFLRFPR